MIQCFHLKIGDNNSTWKGRSRGQPGLDPGGWAVRVSGLHLGARMWMTAIAFAFESGASRGWGEGVERAGRWGLSRSEEG